jgi:hypothetical protein
MDPFAFFTTSMILFSPVLALANLQDRDNHHLDTNNLYLRRQILQTCADSDAWFAARELETCKVIASSGVNLIADRCASWVNEDGTSAIDACPLTCGTCLDASDAHEVSGSYSFSYSFSFVDTFESEGTGDNSENENPSIGDDGNEDPSTSGDDAGEKQDAGDDSEENPDTGDDGEGNQGNNNNGRNRGKGGEGRKGR